MYPMGCTPVSFIDNITPVIYENDCSRGTKSQSMDQSIIKYFPNQEIKHNMHQCLEVPGKAKMCFFKGELFICTR